MSVAICVIDAIHLNPYGYRLFRIGKRLFQRVTPGKTARQIGHHNAECSGLCARLDGNRKTHAHILTPAALAMAATIFPPGVVIELHKPLDVDAFIALGCVMLSKYTVTWHNTGNQLVEADGDAAWAEHYTISSHRIAADDTGPERDFVASGRYIDRMERRDGGLPGASCSSTLPASIQTRRRRFPPAAPPAKEIVTTCPMPCAQKAEPAYAKRSRGLLAVRTLVRAHRSTAQPRQISARTCFTPATAPTMDQTHSSACSPAAH